MSPFPRTYTPSLQVLGKNPTWKRGAQLSSYALEKRARVSLVGVSAAPDWTGASASCSINQLPVARISAIPFLIWKPLKPVAFLIAARFFPEASSAAKQPCALYLRTELSLA